MHYLNSDYTYKKWYFLSHCNYVKSEISYIFMANLKFKLLKERIIWILLSFGSFDILQRDLNV